MGGHLVISLIYGLVLHPGKLWFGLDEVIEPIKKICPFLKSKKFLFLFNLYFGLCRLDRMGKSKLQLIWTSVFGHNSVLHLYILYLLCTKGKTTVGEPTVEKAKKT